MAKYVAYMIAPSHRGDALFFAPDALNNQEKNIQDFLQKHESELMATFVEVGGSQRHRHRWPQLQNAVKYCKHHHAHLLIAEIRNLTHNESFSNIISAFLTNTNSQPYEVHCLDQPFITRETFGAIVKHANEQRKYHGKLIKEGLHRAHAHPGNPRAFEVISKVNKPKIDNAITFSLLMMPVIHDCQQKGFSQRKIVQQLNEEGYHAPEGGNWVLSQLQKVLDRMKFNEIALTLEKRILEFENDNIEDAHIAESLNATNTACPKGKLWNESMVQKIKERIKQIHDIIRMNEFIIALLPLLTEFHIDELHEQRFIEECEKAGIQLPTAWVKPSLEGPVSPGKIINLNPDKLNNLVQQIESQCPDVESLLSFIKKRLEGEINTAKALTEHPTYTAKEDRFKQRGFNHPLINTLLQQHRLLAVGAVQHLTHSYADRQLKRNLGNRL